ncbi:hypothetical protein SLEP1_g17157 [Rubroshorea leprosula]|uniref:Uncharacterized protein n=1 Tax=Rubroshorea leprosula TaxID=152421 RepID=A0AAV5J2G7_9ROSI|nr:hypothetical protein SLEP1_g17157 [Rubroshorea leprosula]
MNFSRSDANDEDIEECCVTQNSQPTANCNKASKTVKGDGDETDVMHGGDAAQQQDPKKNNHDDKELPDIVHSDANDEYIGEGCVTQNSQPTPNYNEALETTKGDGDETDVAHEGDVAQQQNPKKNDHDDEDLPNIVHSDADDEKGERVPVRINNHGDLGSDFSFENSEDEFEVSSDDSSDYLVADEDELTKKKM